MVALAAPALEIQELSDSVNPSAEIWDLWHPDAGVRERSGKVMNEAIRRKYGSQERFGAELAKALGKGNPISQARISKWANARAKPHPHKIPVIAQLLDLPLPGRVTDDQVDAIRDEVRQDLIERLPSQVNSVEETLARAQMAMLDLQRQVAEASQLIADARLEVVSALVGRNRG